MEHCTLDERFMQRALGLAQRGSGRVAPNPLVGAVLVHNNCIIGEGWHQKYGGPHAEVNCIASVAASDRDKIGESTMYVTLEPCAHFGKTPPCANLIIEYKIPRVVIACTDTYSKVAGKGIQLLRNAGIDVQVGMMEQQARELNRRFFTFHEQQRPYIILKWAQSSDGFIAPPQGQKVMLSNALSQRYVHQMRHAEAAILVGFRTALYDNPLLSDRYFSGPNPLRLVIDPQNSLPDDLCLKSDGQATIIFNFLYEGSHGPITYVQISPQKSIAHQVADYLFHHHINSLIVEGGTKTLDLFIESGLWDEAHIIQTTQALCQGQPAPILQDAVLQDANTLYTDKILRYMRSQP